MPWLYLLFVFVFFSVSPSFAALPQESPAFLSQLEKALLRHETALSTLDNAHRLRLREVERAYFKEVNTLLLEEPKAPAPRGIFETSKEYKKRLESHRKEVHAIRRSNEKAVYEKRKRGGVRSQVAKEEIFWLKEQIKTLSPMIKKIALLQRKGCIRPGEAATITIHRPEADAFHFPITITYKKRLYRFAWAYPHRSEARKIWENRHALTATPIFRPEPSDAPNKPHLILSSFDITDASKKSLATFDVEAPAPFDASLRLKRIQTEELPSAKILMALDRSMDGPLPGMRFVFISPRRFLMGSPIPTPGRSDDETLHWVKLTRAFYIMNTEVTQNQWEKLMGSNPSSFQECGGDCPVENVYWQDVNRFIAKLNAMHKGKGRFRLPTEAEWEYAAKAGREDPWVTSAFPPSDYAWFRNNSGGSPRAVATRKPNLWNLYDMNGNVAEWTADWYGPYPNREVENPKGPLRGAFRVSRGGSWFHGIDNTRSASRNTDNNNDKSRYTGFRLVFDIPLKKEAPTF